MVKRALWSFAVLAAAATLPAICFTASDYWKKLGRAAGSAPVASGAKSGAGAPSPVAAAAGGSLPESPAPQLTPLLEGAPVRDLTEVLRFDVTPDWIMRRWPRVSTGLAQLPLQGYRVPLVTGTAENDLAGALTYYFNPHLQLQRITFHGTTGDAGNLVAVLAARHQLTRRLTNDPSMAVYEAVSSVGRPASALRIRSAPVIKASEPHKRFDVELVLERPEE